jgi:hypothetical protein
MAKLLTREFLAYLAGTCWGIFGACMAVIWLRWRYEWRIARLRWQLEDMRSKKSAWRKIANDRIEGRRNAA